MRLSFEIWLDGQDFSVEAASLFEEAINCYKTRSYRAAFIMSYLGFLTSLRDRLLTAEPPEGYTPANWQRRLSALRDSEKWDSSVYQCTQVKKNTVVFPIPDELRLQVTYFRDRRNDCAHGKQHGIGYESVENFWFFLQNNLGRFVVNGSEAALLKRLEDHFNPNLTAPGTPVAPIIADFPRAVDQSQYNDFLRELTQTLATHTQKGKIVLGSRRELLLVFEELILLNISPLTKEILGLLESKDILLDFLRAFPHRTSLIHDRSSLIRQLWKEGGIFKSPEGIQIYIALIRNGMIPSAEIMESLESFIKDSSDWPEGEALQPLEQNGLWQVFETKVFYDPGAKGFKVGFIDLFEWANSHKQLIIQYLEKFGMTESAVRGISETFRTGTHPWRLKTALDDYLKENPTRLKELITTAEQLNLPQPLKLETVANALESSE